MPPFLDKMVQKYEMLRKKVPKKVHSKDCAKLLSKHIIQYFEAKHERDTKAGRTRKTTALSTAQTVISLYKTRLRDLGAPEEFLQHLGLNREQVNQLIRAKAKTVHEGAIDLHEIPGDAVITDCRAFLDHENPHLVMIGLACLTGRRMAEILYSIRFTLPEEVHATNEKYWASTTGILKRRKGDTTDTRREVPLLQTRDKINAAIAYVRQKMPAQSVQEVNRKYAKPLSRAVKKYCPVIGKLHQFRKFYVLACFHYFNDRHCSLPRIAADYLGHKTMTQTVITYLNFRVIDLGGLNFRI
uniref:Telomere resolvase ResT/TelK catalytic domain-containing protein n=1 Tax=viral metagenome TaxID=1070528 RepID=A0A6C0BPS5_9ZZZZ